MSKDALRLTCALAGILGMLMMWASSFIAIGHSLYQFAQGFALAEILWFNFKLWVAIVAGGFVLYCTALGTTLSMDP